MRTRTLARRIGFAVVLVAGLGFEFSAWGERVTNAVLELQVRALGGWNQVSSSGRAARTAVDAGTAIEGADIQPLSRVVAASLVVVGALVWWESSATGWAIASSLAALAALLAVSTMMLPRGVLVPTAGPGVAIIAGVLGRRALEAALAIRDRRRRTGGRSPPPH